MTKEEKRKKERLEVKWFFIILLSLLLAFLLFLKFAYVETKADEVILTEAPQLIGGNTGGSSYSEDFVIDITDRGSNESVQSEAPNQFNDGSANDEFHGVDPVVYTDDSGINIIFLNENGRKAYEAVRKLNGDNIENTESSGINEEIYVPDSDDDCPVSAAVPLPVELQEYLWTKAKKATGDYKNYYAFLLGVIEHESTFRASATHHNSNGSVDRGIMQINSSNIGKMRKAGLINSGEDLYDAYKCIDCGVHMLNNYISKFGVSESAYYAYNTGREKHGSNKNSRIVMGYMSKWNTILFG